jgi:hypothetical protein
MQLNLKTLSLLPPLKPVGFVDEGHDTVLNESTGKKKISSLHGVIYIQLAGLDPDIPKSLGHLAAEMVAIGAHVIGGGCDVKDLFFAYGELR